MAKVEYLMSLGEDLTYGVDWDAFLTDEGKTLFGATWTTTPATGLGVVANSVASNVALIRVKPSAKGYYRMRCAMQMTDANGEIKQQDIFVGVIA